MKDEKWKGKEGGAEDRTKIGWRRIWGKRKGAMGWS